MQEIECGLRFELNDDNKTGKVVSSPQVSGHIVIPKIVTNGGREYIITSIGREAFLHNKDIIDIDFPENSEVKTIYPRAFAFSSLRKISFPGSLVDLKDGCFEKADKLSSFMISPTNLAFEFIENKYLINVTKGRELVFAKRDIKDADIPADITRIGNRAFAHCENLKTVNFETIGCQIKEIGKKAFFRCKNLQTISYFPESIKKFGSRCFEGSEQLVSVEFRAEKVTLKFGCFYKCKNLALALFPNAKEVDLGKNVFTGVSDHFLKQLSTPGAVTKEI